MPMNSAWLEACSALDRVNLDTLHDIATHVAARQRYKLAELLGMHRGDYRLNLARFEAWEMSWRAGHSSTKIGRYYSDRDHSTILSGIKRWRAINASASRAA